LIGLEVVNRDFDCPAGNTIGDGLPVHPHRTGNKLKASRDNVGNRDIFPVSSGICAVLDLNGIGENISGLGFRHTGALGNGRFCLAAVNLHACVGKLDILPVRAFHNGGVGDVHTLRALVNRDAEGVGFGLAGLYAVRYQLQSAAQ
jgi:hypothetical protein